MKAQKALFLTGTANFIRLFSTFIVTKVIANFLGVAGVGKIGEFSNVVGLLQSLASSLWNLPIIKLTSEFKDDEKNTQKLYSSLSLLIIITGVFFGIFIGSFSITLSNLLFETNSYAYLFIILAITMPFLLINSSLQSLLNANREISKYVLSLSLGSITTLISSVLLILTYQLTGGLLSIVLGQSMVIFFTVYLVIKCKWFKLTLFALSSDPAMIKRILSYSSVGIVSAVGSPLSQLFARTYLAKNFSWHDAGIWQAVNLISNAYLSFFSMSLQAYFLPKLASIKNKRELRSELITSLKIAVPIITLCAIMAYALKKYIILVLFTKEFSQISDVIQYQLIGDVFQAASYLIAYVLLANAKIKILLATETVFPVIYCFFLIEFTKLFGIKGAFIAFSANYLLFLVTVSVITFTYLKDDGRQHAVR